VQPQGRFKADNGVALAAAAVAGLGIAALPDFLTKKELASGALVAPTVDRPRPLRCTRNSAAHDVELGNRGVQSEPVIALSSDHNPSLEKGTAGPGQRTRASWSGLRAGFTEAYQAAAISISACKSDARLDLFQ
jgi:LysR substrate binding domain